MFDETRHRRRQDGVGQQLPLGETAGDLLVMLLLLLRMVIIGGGGDAAGVEAAAVGVVVVAALSVVIGAIVGVQLAEFGGLLRLGEVVREPGDELLLLGASAAGWWRFWWWVRA